MHVVYKAADPLEAMIIRDLLREAGLSAECLDHMAMGAQGELAANLFPRVAVRWQQEVGRAREIIADYERSPRIADWHCPGCGEQVAGNMGLCWNCGGQPPGNAPE